MDTQDFYEDEKAPKKELEINQQSRAYLLEITKWAKFFSILGFIITGLIVFVSLFMGTIMQGLGSLSKINPGADAFNTIGTGASIAITIFYLLFGLLYFFPSLYMYNFSTKMKLGLSQNEAFNVEEGFKNLKSVFKFWGIFTIVCLSLYTLMIVFGLMASLAFS